MKVTFRWKLMVSSRDKPNFIVLPDHVKPLKYLAGP